MTKIAISHIKMFRLEACPLCGARMRIRGTTHLLYDCGAKYSRRQHKFVEPCSEGVTMVMRELNKHLCPFVFPGC